jgi:phosphomannomutase
MNRNKAIFDVDGTLTDSRQLIDSVFATWFLDFCYSNDVYLVSGSDYSKTLQQLGKEICTSCKRVYSCSGSDIWQNGINIYSKSWQPPQELLDYLNSWLFSSKFSIKTGNHLEIRNGCINFSIVGRNASTTDRQYYIAWDKLNRERESIAHSINSLFTGITASIGGETGLDIYPTGWDKSQILPNVIADLDTNDKLYFFGDKTAPGGNDYSIAAALKYVYTVRNWKDTREILLYLQESGIFK